VQQFIIGLGLLLVWLWGVGIGHAEEETPVVQTEEVVTSATKTPVPVSHLTSAVEVITGEEMQRKKLKTVIDALRLAQGLMVTQNGGPGTQATVRMRGANTTQTLVVLDGTIMNSATTGDFNFGNLTAENIERVEILRGAQGMLWGSDAIGGVINIVTKKGGGTPTASTFMEYGSFSSLREGAQASGAKGPVDYSMSLTRWDMKSFSVANYRRGATEGDPFHNWQASGKLGIALPKDGRFEFNLRWWDSDVNLDNTNADVLGYKQTTKTTTLSGMYEQPITDWWIQKLTLAQTDEVVRSSNGTRSKNLTTGVVSNLTLSRTYLDINNRRLEWQHNFQVSELLLLTTGYQMRNQEGVNPSIDPNGKTIYSQAGFGQAQVNLWDRLLMTAGLRQDSYNVFGDATTYRVTGGYLHKETGTKLRGSFATGFRTPTVNQLYFPGFGDPNLKPEKSKSMDFGVDQRLVDDKLLVSVGYFWNHFNNLIQNVPANTSSGFQAQNIGQAKSQGWETSLTYALLKNLDVKGQYTYTLTRDLLTTRRLQQWPIHSASLGVYYRPIDQMNLSLDYRYVGSRFNDVNNTQKLGSFGVVNVASTYDITKHWQAFGRVDNLFNQYYEEIMFFGTPTRSVYGGVRYTF